MKEDCYWYDEDRDMGARIPFCKMQKGFTPLRDKDCEGCQSYHSKYKQINADRIRAMTDEELDDFLQDVAMQGGIELGGRLTTWLDWLKREVDER